MKKGDTLCILRDSAPPLRSRNTILASILVTLGIPLDEHCPYQETVEKSGGSERRVVTYVFQSQSHDGQFQTAKMIAAWHDKDFIRDNPEHPMAYLKAFAANHSVLLKLIKESVPLICVRRGTRAVLIPADATPDERASWMEKLNK